MLKVALKGLATRRLRALLTALAIVLGVALVAGTYVLTDSITGAFDSIFQTVYRGTDATITGRSAIDSGADAGAVGGSASTPSFPESVLAQVQRLPDVRETLGGVSGSPQLVKNGKAITFGGAPNLVRVNVGATGGLSLYPFGLINTPTHAVGIASQMDWPSVCRIGQLRSPSVAAPCHLWLRDFDLRLGPRCCSPTRTISRRPPPTRRTHGTVSCRSSSASCTRGPTGSSPSPTASLGTCPSGCT